MHSDTLFTICYVTFIYSDLLMVKLTAQLFCFLIVNVIS